jgi:hypothetical protein
MRVGAYTLDLYCENNNINSNGIDDGKHVYGKDYPRQIVAEHGKTCRKIARREGWLLCRDGRTYCPACSGKKKSACAALAEEGKA